MNQQMMMRLKKMQKELEETQKRIAETVYEGQSAGICTIGITGDHKMVKLEINPDALESKDDLEMISDAIMSAYNDACNKLEKDQQSSLSKFGGMGLF